MLESDWLAPRRPILNAIFTPITAFLKRYIIIKVPRAPHHPVPKSYGHPKSMNKLPLTSQQLLFVRVMTYDVLLLVKVSDLFNESSNSF